MSRREFLVNLAEAQSGAKVLFATDDFFAVCGKLWTERECMLQHEEPVFDVNAYTDQGKLMDGIKA